jgi:hypothetical protein
LSKPLALSMIGGFQVRDFMQQAPLHGGVWGISQDWWSYIMEETLVNLLCFNFIFEFEEFSFTFLCNDID